MPMLAIYVHKGWEVTYRPRGSTLQCQIDGIATSSRGICSVHRGVTFVRSGHVGGMQTLSPSRMWTASCSRRGMGSLSLIRGKNQGKSSVGIPLLRSSHLERNMPIADGPWDQQPTISLLSAGLSPSSPAILSGRMTSRLATAGSRNMSSSSVYIGSHKLHPIHSRLLVMGLPVTLQIQPQLHHHPSAAPSPSPPLTPLPSPTIIRSSATTGPTALSLISPMWLCGSKLRSRWMRTAAWCLSREL